jgi:hypothetical protein
MKRCILFGAFAILLLSAGDCSEKKTTAGKLKARFEIKGICSNYTIKLIEGNIDTSLYLSAWVNEATGKTHNNVFALGNPCEFPDSLKEGDEFYFTIDSAKRKECTVCMAYYPKPSRMLSIKVTNP